MFLCVIILVVIGDNIMDEHRIWLNELKVGDTVYISCDGTFARKKVSKLTSTQIVVEYKNASNVGYEVRFNRKNGKMLGSNLWHTSYIVKATDEILNKIRYNEMKSITKRKLDNLDVCKMSIEQLYKLNSVLDEINEKSA